MYQRSLIAFHHLPIGALPLLFLSGQCLGKRPSASSDKSMPHPPPSDSLVLTPVKLVSEYTSSLLASQITNKRLFGNSDQNSSLYQFRSARNH